MTLSAGDPAPAVRARNQDGDVVEPDFSTATPTVVYFYPEDGTSGCRTEASQFEREYEHYEAAGVSVYGVSTDSVDSHREFADAEGLSFDLLADPDGVVADAFGLQLRQGRAPRTTFVLADGEVHAVYEHVGPDGHARDLMLDLFDEGLVDLDL